MAGTPSESALFAIGTQTAKGTAKNTGFVMGLMEQSSLLARPDPLTKVAEHGLGAGLATAKKTPTRYGSYAVTGAVRSNLYLDALGHLLQGAGFTSAAATGATAAKTHVFTLSARDAQLWLTALWKLGTDEKMATDVRVPRLSIEATSESIKYNATLLGLKLTDSVGNETHTHEDIDSEIYPTAGSVTFTPAAGTGIVTSATSIQRATIEIANNLDEGDRALFRWGRADLPQTGLAITGKIDGFDLDYAIYDALVRANASSGEPAQSATVGTLVYVFTGANMIGATATPYSLTIDFKKVECTLDDFVADGANLVRWNTSWQMIDEGSADTVEITLVSEYASYVPA